MPKLNKTGERILATHRSYIGKPQKIRFSDISIGDIIRFMYDGEERTVLVLNQLWHEQLHGLSLKSIDRRTLMVEVFAKFDLFQNPMGFYNTVISRPAVADTHSYRTYNPNRMSNIRRLAYNVDERGRERL